MYYRNNTLTFAPTDLSRWSSSPYASWMARYAAENPKLAPAQDEPDAMLSRLAQRGLAHEDALEQQFRNAGRDLVNVATSVRSGVGNATSNGDAAELTRELLHAGTDVIAQAVLERDSFRGHADFLVKVPGHSELGDFHYEVWDTKLARRIRPGMVLQLCCYVDMLEAVQGRIADDLVVALGTDKNERVPLIDCFDYYHAVKAAFLTDQASWSSDEEPDPADHSDHGDWSEHAAAKLEAADHLGRVARITRREIERLVHAGIPTMTALADAAGSAVTGITSSRTDWLVRQAALQCASASLDAPKFHLLDQVPDKSTGLSALPDASSLDVFFDIEGFPLEGDGLEYLWGCTYLDDDGTRAFRDWWAHDTREERQAFEGFIDWVYDRWRTDPSMHIYHYAPYEITACKRLMSTHGTREHELDELLRHHVFIDLYAIVTHGLQIGEPRYSIKNVERLYRAKRETDVASGGDSVVVYDLWREAYARGEESGDWHESEVLNGIRDYNRDDCDSTLELCEWLRARRDSSIAPAVIEALPKKELPDVLQTRHALRDSLLMKADDASIDEWQRTLFETLGGVLEFHWREYKSQRWIYHHRMDPANTSLADDPACVDRCHRTNREAFKPTKARNFAYEYAFDADQELNRLSESVYLKGTESDDGVPLTATVLHEESDLDAGRLVLKCGSEPPDIMTLVPNESIRADPIPSAIDAVVGAIADNVEGESALLDFLKRRPPRIRDHDGGPVVRSPETALADTIAAVMSLDNSCLVIQGPPGAGKTYTGARVIAALIAEGRRVGISSNSHNAINNLLISAATHCRNEGIDGHFVCTKSTSEELDDLGIAVLKNADLEDQLCDGCVIGTTAWGFAREDLAEAFDVLIIDEAGQVSLANLIGMSRSARNLVVMGDQRQLGQPTQGKHPAESGLSVLDYRLGDTAAVDPRHGVFLGTTFRMHPAVNALVSKYVYAGRLQTAPANSTRVLELSNNDGPPDREAGIAYLPVEHEYNQQASDEEVSAIVEAVQSLEGRLLARDDGASRPVTLDDMLFVAPYNAQVAQLKQALGKSARVGSVDRFQGQEAPIVFLSLCSSDATTSPRGIGFLFDRNRLNVAVSRAETLCVLVGHPRLAVTAVRTLQDLKRVNFVAALMAAGA